MAAVIKRATLQKHRILKYGNSVLIKLEDSKCFVTVFKNDNDIRAKNR